MTSNRSPATRRSEQRVRLCRLECLLVLLAGAFLTPRLHAVQADSIKYVLVLLPGQSGLPATGMFLGGFRETLLAAQDVSVDVSTEHIGASQAAPKKTQRKLSELLTEKYGDRRFDIVVAWGRDALDFLVEEKATLWPDAKALALVMGRPDERLRSHPDIVSIVVDCDFRGTVAAIKRMHPETRHIALVGGYAAEDRLELELARTACREGFPGVEIVDPKGNTPREMMEGLAVLPESTVVIVASVLADARGRPVLGADWLRLAFKTSRSPIYVIFAHLVGSGAVGGSVTDFEKVGAEAGARTLRILRGQLAGGSQVEHFSFHSLIFDWRALTEWGISEDRLPPGSEVRFRSPTFWGEYRWYILGTLGLLAVFTLATTWLFIERRNRKRAQKDLAERFSLETERLKLEALVADLSVPLLKASPERLPVEIANGLRQMAELLGFDRGTYFEIAPESHALLAVAAGGKPGTPLFAAGEVIELPWAAARLRRGETVLFDPKEHRFPEDARGEQEFVHRTGVRSALLVPIEDSGGVLGVLSFGAFEGRTKWSPELVTRLRIVGRLFSGVIAQRRSDVQLREALGEVTALKQKLEAENRYLREAAGVMSNPEEITGESEVMKSVLVQIERVAPTDATVLILGETGTGKELIASSIHRLSRRKEHPMVKVNCAALPPTLIEAELFGREKGAYTGALSKQAGRFELAHGSTIFLDEIGELTPELQVKLLRVLQDGEFQRVGSTQTINVDVRVIAATNRDLAAAVREGRFREDLFYRLNVFPISVPPLRVRREDIPLLAWTFAKELGEALGKPVDRIPHETMESLKSYPWPGNVRELRNVIERSLILGDSSSLRVSLTPATAASEPIDGTIEEAERRIILEALEKSSWRVRGPGGAAEILHLKPSTLEYRMKKYGLRRPI